MKKYIQTDQLQQQIDWDNLMMMPRHAGGHDQQMKGLFKNSTLIGHWNEGYYQGMVATCVRLSDGRYAIYNDYYGSCSGCDSWEDADDKNVRAMCINLSNGTYIFENLKEVKEFLENARNEHDWTTWNEAGHHLLENINENVSFPISFIKKKL